MPEALTTKEAKCQTAETIPVSIIGQMLNVKIQKCKWRKKKNEMVQFIQLTYFSL